MKKERHIILAGISRGGKTTICRELLKHLNHTYIPMDSIVRGFQVNFPEIGITHADSIIHVSPKLAPFLNTMMEDSKEQLLLLDTYHIIPKDYIRYVRREDANIYFVGYPDLSAQEKLNEMRRYDQRKENTVLTDEQLLANCAKKIQESQYIRKECEKYGLPFINTSYQRNEVIHRAVQEICKNSSII